MKYFAAEALFASALFINNAFVDAFAVPPNANNSGPHPHVPSDKPLTRPPPLPKTNNPHALLGFDWLSPPADFEVVHSAYRNYAKLYHPDRVVGPDASYEEREAANMDFQRINDAYDKLKARQDEETFEVIVMGGNSKKTKMTQYYTTSEEIRKNDPNRVNVQRILEIRDRFPNAKRKNWATEEYKHQPGGRHNGDFGPLRR
jgi:hypothetical protein